MGPASRIESHEDQMASIHATIRSTVMEEVSAAVKGAVAAMETTLTNRFVNSFEEMFTKQERQIEDTTKRLEGRINRSREYQESLISTIKDEQVKFQGEVRTALLEVISLGKGQGKTAEMIINPSGEISMGRSGETMLGENSSHGKGLVFGENSHTGRGSGGGPGGGVSLGHPIIGGGANWRFKKLDMPGFDGNNPDGWILRAERYHNFYRLTEEDKLEAAVVALEGDALLWFQ